MSEFKFACPVCGQHITADSSNSGGQLECPTCFQKLIIPQAPSSKDPQFIISATQVGKPRPTSANGTAGFVPAKEHSGLLMSIALAVVLVGAASAAYVFRDKIFHSSRPQQGSDNYGQAKPAPPPPVDYPVPTNISWNLELSNLTIPDEKAVGSIHGSGFFCESATLQGGQLTLRQGKSGPADLGITIKLFAQQGEELSGKTIQISADREPPLPKITLRWKDELLQAKTLNISAGYVMKLAFGQADKGRMPGRIFICLPDEEKSFVAGTFEARIRPPKPRG